MNPSRDNEWAVVDAWIKLFDQEKCYSGITRLAFDRFLECLAGHCQAELYALDSKDPVRAEQLIRKMMIARLPLHVGIPGINIQESFEELYCGRKLPTKALYDTFCYCYQSLRLKLEVADQVKAAIFQEVSK